MKTKIYNVLFLCTGNSARSIMAEALLNTLGKEHFRAFSAGSHPAGSIHPLTIELVKTIGYSLENLRSKSWDEFAHPNVSQMDFIITVCDSAAGEVCPVWPGHPISAHWGFKDPSAVQGSEKEKRQIFEKVFNQIKNRINLLINLPLNSLDHNAIMRELKKIGETDEHA